MPRRLDPARVGARPGFVLPLALFALTIIALLVAVLLDGAVRELRMARGDVSAARARALAETALADALAERHDSTLLASPRGANAVTTVGASGDTATTSTQALGGGVFRVMASGRSWAGRVRGDAGVLGFARLVADSSGPPGTLRLRRLPGWWWTQLP